MSAMENPTWRSFRVKPLLRAALLAGVTHGLTNCTSAEDASHGVGGLPGSERESATGGGALEGFGAGGAPSAGAASGGAATGEVAAGGNVTGGGSAEGALTGGAPLGEDWSGGANTAGAPRGGVETGGAPAGGSSDGGTTGVGTGGASVGGSGDGGTVGVETGGASVGGSGDGGTAGVETGGASVGGSGDGGTTGVDTGGASVGGTGGTLGGEFELVWEDPCDTVDLSRWELMTHSWDGNLAQFSGENATASGGIVSLSLTSANDPTKPFRGVEMRSRDTLVYGKVEASIRFAAGSAVVSSLVLIYTPWPPDDWNELDIEFLGKNTDSVQFNHMINIPPADPASGHLQFPQSVPLPFNPAADFHTFAIEWVPGEARFLVDGTLMHTATEEMARMVLPQNILLTIWASDSASWAGPVDSTTAPTSAEYDWIRVYRYVGP